MYDNKTPSSTLKNSASKSTSIELKNEIINIFSEIKTTDKSTEEKLKSFSERCKELLEGQITSRIPTCRAIILEKLYELHKSKDYPKIKNKPINGKKPSASQVRKKRSEANTVATKLFENFFDNELFQRVSPSIKTNLDSLMANATESSTLSQYSTESLRTKTSYEIFCENVAFNIGLVILTTTATLIASSYGAFPMMTAVIITSATNFVTNNLVQYYNTKKLEDIIGDKPSYLRSLIISNLIILAGNTLAIAALVYASQGVLPVITAGLMVATLYIAFEYTKFKGYANITDNEPPKSKTMIRDEDRSTTKGVFNSVMSLFSGTPDEHKGNQNSYGNS
ncbi:MAG: hypothetical protein P8L77_03190 [Gammaproteobacteria bacterium]|nr:hypothetical protein [Gammaproteobacteria bacterium]